MKRKYLAIALITGAAMATTSYAAPVSFSGAQSTYLRPTLDFPISEAINGNLVAGGWALNGTAETADLQSAIFTTTSPLSASNLNFALNFTSCCAQHSINEYRLSATTDAVPLLAGGNWTPLSLGTFQSQTPASTFSVQPGGSVRALGAGAPFDIFASSAAAPFAGITGFKLDVIPFDRNGDGTATAGNAPNGNFVLTEFRVDDATPFNVRNFAIGGIAYANGPVWSNAGGSAGVLIDGNITNQEHGTGPGGPTGVPNAPGFHYDINLGQSVSLDHIDIIPRNGCCNDRLTNYRVTIHEDNNGVAGDVVWSGDFRTNGSIPPLNNPPPDLVNAGSGSGTFAGQWIRIESLQNPNPAYALQIADVQVYGASTKGPNVAQGKPTTGDVAFGFGTGNAVDGRIDTISHSLNEVPAFLQVDLEAGYNLTEVELVNRADRQVPERLDGAVLSVLDENFDTLFVSDPIVGALTSQTFRFDNGGLGFPGARYIRVDQVSPDADSYLSVAELRAYGTAVPEPSTFVLAAFGGAALMWSRRKR